MGCAIVQDRLYRHGPSTFLCVERADISYRVRLLNAETAGAVPPSLPQERCA